MVWGHENPRGSFDQLLLFQRSRIQFFCTGPGKLGFFSAPQIILMGSQGGSVKNKVPGPTATDFESVGLEQGGRESQL